MTADDLQNTAKDTASAAQDVADSAKEAASDMTASLKGRASEALDRVSDIARDGLEKVGQRVPGSVGDAVGAGKQAYAEGSERVSRQVSRQPIEALLLAGAIGYLVGWAANRG